MARGGGALSVTGRDIRTIAVIGTGTIGASWAALFVAHGYDVMASDPASDAEQRLRDTVAHAVTEIAVAHRNMGRLSFTADAEAAVANCDLIQENAPERQDLKAGLIARLMAAAPAHAILASSTTAFPRSALVTATALTAAERVIVAHPFNPPHLVPLVEIVASSPDAPAARVAVEFYRSVGREPVVLRREAVGHLANRLQAALVREAIYCLEQGIADVADIDRAVKFGPGLRWAWMGPFETYHLAGGAGGIRHYLDHLGPSQVKRWESLGSPQLTEDLKAKIASGVEAMVAGQSSADLAARRDEALKAVSSAIKKIRGA